MEFEFLTFFFSKMIQFLSFEICHYQKSRNFAVRLNFSLKITCIQVSIFHFLFFNDGEI